jgi:hypothetical protein
MIFNVERMRISASPVCLFQLLGQYEQLIAESGALLKRIKNLSRNDQFQNSIELVGIDESKNPSVAYRK